MKTLEQAARQALDALELYPVTVNHWKAVLLPAAKALREALEQPAQRRETGWLAPKDHYAVPVLFNPYSGEPRDARDVQSDPQGILIVPPGKVEMLAAQPEPVVDSKEKASAYMEARLWEFIDMAGMFPEAKPDARTWAHVMVYAPAQQQETAATVQCINGVTIGYLDVMLPVGTKLYAAPQQREPWVGLTEDDWQDIADSAGQIIWSDVKQAIETKLREKNT